MPLVSRLHLGGNHRRGLRGQNRGGDKGSDDQDVGFGMLNSRVCRALEFAIRYCFVNIPTFVMVSFPDLDRVCSVFMTYLLLQVVGICWAILINAGFALACRVTYILPQIHSHSTDVDGVVGVDLDMGSFSFETSMELMFSFYVAYASIRVVMNFAQSIFSIALESTKDFPNASKQAVEGGVSTLYLTRLAFLPAIALQIGLLAADSLCLDIQEELGKESSCISAATTGNTDRACHDYNVGDYQQIWKSASSSLRSKICSYTGFSYLTSTHHHLRSVVFSMLLIMVLQIWQAYLQQFPRWAMVFQSMKTSRRLLFQAAATILMLVTILTLSTLFIGFISTGIDAEKIVCAIMLGWTLWLYLFVPELAANRGEAWMQSATAKHIQHMMAYIRISQVMMLLGLFGYLSLKWGVLQAQLDLTFITILLPTMYCTIYLIGNRILKVNSSEKASLLLMGATGSLLCSITMCYFASAAANGSLLLVFLHIMSKLVEFYDYTSSSAKLDDDYDLNGEYSKSLSVNGNGGDISSPPIFEEKSLLLRPAHAEYSIADNTRDAGDAGDAGASTTRNMEALPSPSSLGGEMSNTDDVGVDVDVGPGLDLESSNDEIDGITQHSSKSPFTKSSPQESPPPSSLCSSDMSPSPPARDRANSTLLRSHSYGYLGDNTGSGGSCPDQFVPIKSKQDQQSFYALKRRGNSSDSLMNMVYDDGSGSLDEERVPPSPGANRNRASSISTRFLSERGQGNNPLVSLNIPSHVRQHWLLRLPKRNMRFIGNMARSVSWTNVDNVYSGTIRAFVSLGVLLTLIMFTVTIAAYTQKSLNAFPTIIDMEVHPSVDKKTGRDTQTVLFDHKVATVSLQMNPDLSSRYTNANTFVGKLKDTFSMGLGNSNAASYATEVQQPHYMACSWQWKSLGIFDFALLSEIAYFDEGGVEENINGVSNVQHIVDTVFPNDDFIATSSHPDKSGVGPRYVEFSSKMHDMTILAVRGTDVGRLHDIMEDFKLFAEPVIFAILSTAFPSIRMWNHETTARIIEWLYEFNSFFGLQGEPDYYRPLAQRVMDIADRYAEAKGDSSTTKSKKGKGSNDFDPNLVITGHSLGGGLARIVGTLTGQPSVSFGPPGLGLSYRKYSFDAKGKEGEAKNTIRVKNMDHQSLAIITEFDWVPQIDQQVGLVQNIQCDHKKQSNNAILSTACHAMETTTCHLLRHCGDPQGRFTSCNSTFEMTAMAPSVGSFLWQTRYLSLPLSFFAIAFMILAVVPELV